MYNLKQEYDKYTEEDFKVWHLLYDKQSKVLPGRACLEFLEGMMRMGFNRNEIARFDEINKVLAETTGWVIEVVPGLIPDKNFFELLADKKFPSSTWLRKMSELEYLEEPDMFHDTFAHMPILTVQFFVDYLQELSKIALKHIDNPLAIELIGRLYWFTVEFGLINNANGLRIYGAGILSSSGESVYCLGDEATRKPLNVKEILELHYYKDHYQDRYYVIKSYKQLFDAIPEIDERLQEALKKYDRIKEDVTKLDLVLN